MRHHINRFRIGRRVAKALHDQIGTKSETGQTNRNSSRVMGPVVSCDPTVVMRGSQYVSW